jgi:hypothetical protein
MSDGSGLGDDQRVERVIGALLRIGVLLAVLMELPAEGARPCQPGTYQRAGLPPPMDQTYDLKRFRLREAVCARHFEATHGQYLHRALDWMDAGSAGGNGQATGRCAPGRSWRHGRSLQTTLIDTMVAFLTISSASAIICGRRQDHRGRGQIMVLKTAQVAALVWLQRSLSLVGAWAQAAEP